MSLRDQQHHHKWKLRLKDWLVMPKPSPQQRSYTWEEVKEGYGGKRLLVFKGMVYDVTTFGSFHPGGEKYIREWVGKDCTAIFPRYHTPAVDVPEAMQGYQVGKLAEAEVAEAALKSHLFDGASSVELEAVVQEATTTLEQEGSPKTNQGDLEEVFKLLDDASRGAVSTEKVLEFVGSVGASETELTKLRESLEGKEFVTKPEFVELFSVMQ